MEFNVVKWDHTKNEGIYKVSERVKSFRRIKDTAFAMVKWLNENNGKFPEPYITAFAVSHCQVEANPYHFFVVNKDLIGKKKSKDGRNTYKNYFFPSQIIVNAEIIEIPEKVQAKKPERIITKENGKVGSKIILKDVEEKNKIGVPEACMSFLHRTAKTVERFYRIKVRYQIPVKILGFWFLLKREEWVEGLKSHIFQHEVDHSQAKNMYYGKTSVTKK